MTEITHSDSADPHVTQAITQPFTVSVEVTNHNDNSVTCLSAACDLSNRKIKECMIKGAVWLQRRGRGAGSIRPIRRASVPLCPGDTLFLYYNAAVLEQIPLEPELLYDRQTYSVWFKPSGMLSHGSKWGDHCSITRWIERYRYPQRSCFLVHRLDRATSGIIIVAHTKKAAAYLCQQFEQRLTRKRYHAVVNGKIPNGIIQLHDSLDGKTAHTDIKLISYDKESHTSLVDVTLHTGRKHQIRRHLAQAGHAIIGDRLYNPAFATTDTLDKDTISPAPDLQLRAYFLGFTCPISLTYQEVTLPSSRFISTNFDLYKK